MRSIAIIPVYREIGKIGRVLERFEAGSVDEICLVLDDPNELITREIEESAKRAQVPVQIIKNPQRNGIGYAIKGGYQYALSQGFDLIVVMAGNGKDDPKEIPRLTAPILKESYDYVQGSRFLPGGRREKTPLLRGIFSRSFPFFWTILTGHHCTEVTNGFRAYKASLLRDPRVNVWQSWLDGYELEYYLHYKALTLGYKFTERPVTKTYSQYGKRGYSHISPMKDWWQIVGPMFLLRLGVRH
jgi:dolichol-phosphate mannosyltransferase